MTGESTKSNQGCKIGLIIGGVVAILLGVGLGVGAGIVLDKKETVYQFRRNVVEMIKPVHYVAANPPKNVDQSGGFGGNQDFVQT